MLVQNIYQNSVIPTSQNPKKDKRFLCHVCCKQFQHKGNLNSHMRSHTGERPYSCNVCEKRFSTSGILKTHMRTHTGEKPYLCDTCGKRFSHIGILKNHMLTHSGERPHRCPVPDCGKDYSRAANLKIHMRSHTGERPFKCDYPKCNWSFASNADLKVHMKSHGVTDPKQHLLSTSDNRLNNEKEKSVSNQLPFIRKHSDKTISYDWIAIEGDLQKAENEKQQEIEKNSYVPRPYCCSLCANSYSTLVKLKCHIKEHQLAADCRPYKCGECSRKFSQPRNIHRHMVLCHGKAESTGPFTLALMSPDRIPFTDKNIQRGGRKRALDEIHKSAFTPVCKSPNTKSPVDPLKPKPSTTLYISNVKSLREEKNPFPDIRPLSDDSTSNSPVPTAMSVQHSGNLQKSSRVKEEKVSPRYHPYTRTPTKIAPKPSQADNRVPMSTTTLSYQTLPVKIEPKLSPVQQVPVTQIQGPTTSKSPAFITSHLLRQSDLPRTSIRPLYSKPTQPISTTLVDQVSGAGVASCFDFLVKFHLANQIYFSLKCFYRCLDQSRKVLEIGEIPW